jgi:hypothetical protein
VCRELPSRTNELDIEQFAIWLLNCRWHNNQLGVNRRQ